MFALRAARAFTGRPLVAKFELAYHGTHDTAVAWTPGVPAGISDLVIELPWADPEGVERAIAGRERELAAIIIEPVQGAGGVRAAPPEFLEFLRDLTSADRGAPRLRRGHRVPDRAERRAGPARRRPPGPHDARQDHRRRLCLRRVRRPRGRHGPVRRAPLRLARPRRHVQRQPGGGCGRTRHAPLPDARALRRARAHWPTGFGRRSLPASIGTGWTPASTASRRSSRSSRDRASSRRTA